MITVLALTDYVLLTCPLPNLYGPEYTRGSNERIAQLSIGC